MKSIILSFCLFMFFVSNGTAQNFEGKITFKMEYSGEMAAQIAAMAPNGMTYQTKGSDTRFEMIGGMSASMLGSFLIKEDEDIVYVIRDNEKKAYKMPIDKQEQVKPKVTKEDEILEILGYKCQKYKVETTVQGQPTTQYVWAAKDIKIKEPKGTLQTGGNLHIEGVEGFPLKTIAEASVMGMTIKTTTLATEVNTAKLKKTNFDLPKGYEVEETTMQELTKKLMGF